MDYETGRAFGDACCEGEFQYEIFLREALVLVRRHASVAAAARLMCVAEAGLRGFLDGAAGHSLIGDEPQGNRTWNFLDSATAACAGRGDGFYRRARETCGGRTPWISLPAAGRVWKTHEPGMPGCMTSMSC